MKFTFHSDPGHGWLEVPVAFLRGLGICDKISPYSYRRGETAYLEEDCDAAVFVNEMRKRGIEFSIVEKYYDNQCFVVNYPSFF